MLRGGIEVGTKYFFNLDARWRWVVNAIPRLLYPRGRPATHCECWLHSYSTVIQDSTALHCKYAAWKQRFLRVFVCVIAEELETDPATWSYPDSSEKIYERWT